MVNSVYSFIGLLPVTLDSIEWPYGVERLCKQKYLSTEEL